MRLSWLVFSSVIALVSMAHGEPSISMSAYSVSPGQPFTVALQPEGVELPGLMAVGAQIVYDPMIVQLDTFLLPDGWLTAHRLVEGPLDTLHLAAAAAEAVLIDTVIALEFHARWNPAGLTTAVILSRLELNEFVLADPGYATVSISGHTGTMECTSLLQARTSQKGWRDTLQITVDDPDAAVLETLIVTHQDTVFGGFWIDSPPPPPFYAPWYQDSIFVKTDTTIIDVSDTTIQSGGQQTPYVSVMSEIESERLQAGRVATTTGTAVADDGILSIPEDRPSKVFVLYDDLMTAEGGTRVLIDTVQVLPLFGDVTGDGWVTAWDAAQVLGHSIGLRHLTPMQRVSADVTFDGKVHLLDAYWIIRAAGWNIDHFDAPEHQ